MTNAGLREGFFEKARPPEQTPVHPDNELINRSITAWGKMQKKHVLSILGRLSRGVLTAAILKDVKYHVQMSLMIYALGVSKDTKFATAAEHRYFSAMLDEAAGLGAKAGNRLHRQPRLTEGQIDWHTIGFFALRCPADSGHQFPVIENMLSGEMYKAPSWVTLSNFDSWTIEDNLVEHETTLTNNQFSKKLHAWVATQDVLAPGVSSQVSEVPELTTPRRRHVAFSPVTGERPAATQPISQQPGSLLKKRRRQ